MCFYCFVTMCCNLLLTSLFSASSCQCDLAVVCCNVKRQLAVRYMRALEIRGVIYKLVFTLYCSFSRCGFVSHADYMNEVSNMRSPSWWRLFDAPFHIAFMGDESASGKRTVYCKNGKGTVKALYKGSKIHVKNNARFTVKEGKVIPLYSG